jgi:hypothetical protein
MDLKYDGRVRNGLILLRTETSSSDYESGTIKIFKTGEFPEQILAYRFSVE